MTKETYLLGVTEQMIVINNDKQDIVMVLEYSN